MRFLRGGLGTSLDLDLDLDLDLGSDSWTLDLDPGSGPWISVSQILDIFLKYSVKRPYEPIYLNNSLNKPQIDGWVVPGMYPSRYPPSRTTPGTPPPRRQYALWVLTAVSGIQIVSWGSNPSPNSLGGRISGTSAL